MTTTEGTGGTEKGEGTRSWQTPLVAGAGGFVGGCLLYALLAGLGGGVDWEDRLTFGQSSALEMQGVGIFLGIVVGTAVGAPLGSYLTLRRAGASRAGLTAVLALFATAAVTTATFALLQPGPQDPVIAPYAVFGGWFLLPFLVRYVIERRAVGDTGRDIDQE